MIEIFIPGVPKPGGSKKAFVNKHTGRASIVDACDKSADWKQDVKVFAVQAHKGPPLTGPLMLTIDFYMPRPKGHFGSGKNADKLKDSAPIYPITKPDCTKLIRSLEDALTGIIWGDDSQVAIQHVQKLYSSVRTGAHVQVEQIGGKP